MLVKGLPRGLPGKGSLTLTRELSNFVFCFVLFFFVFHRVTSESSLSTTGRGGKSAFWQLCLCVEVLRRRSDSPKPVSCSEPQGAACWLAGEWTPTNWTFKSFQLLMFYCSAVSHYWEFCHLAGAPGVLVYGLQTQWHCYLLTLEGEQDSLGCDVSGSAHIQGTGWWSGSFLVMPWGHGKLHQVH